MESERQRKKNSSSNLFPCPTVPARSLQSPDCCDPSSLGIVSGLSHRSVPFASSTSYTVACRRLRLQQQKALSVQSSYLSGTGGTGGGGVNWPQRQHSLPTENSFDHGSKVVKSALVQQQSRPRPRLKRQVTICEDSVSIPDSQLFSEQRCSSLLLPGCREEEEEEEIRRNPSPKRSLTSVLKRQESSFTQDEILSLQEAFAQLDADGNGRLSRKEAEAALGQVLSQADLDYFLLDMRTDENGEVEWHSFLQAMKTRMREPESVKMLKEAFRVVAGESCGGISVAGGNNGHQPLSISAARMKHSLMFSETKASEQEVDEMLTVLDLDGDGKVDMEDFVRLLVNEQYLSGGPPATCSKCTIL